MPNVIITPHVAASSDKVFARVLLLARENLRRYSRSNLEVVVNKSINQTLSRTILTSGTVVMVLVAFLILGGGVVREFALAMFVGVITGTFSSIYVASPIVLYFESVGTKKR